MPVEQKENTQALHARFSEVYRTFFSENDLVVSSDITYALNLSSLNWRVGGPLVCQKLPFKVYVGIRRESGGEPLRIGTAQVYYSDRKRFSEPDYELLNWKRAIPYLTSECLAGPQKQQPSGLVLSFLLEKPEHLSFDCSLSMMVVSALALYVGAVTPEEIRRMTSLSMNEVHAKNSDIAKKFHDLHERAMELMAIAITPATSGSTIYANFFASEHPLIHFTEERGGTTGTRYAGLFPENVVGRERLIRQMRWWGFRLNEVARVSGAFPLDVASISLASGNEELPFYEYVDRAVLPQFQELQDFSAKAFRSVHAPRSQRLPPFLKHLDVPGRFWHEYAVGRAYSGLFFIQKLLNVYQRQLSAQVIEEFLEAFTASLHLDIPPMRSPSKNVRHVMRMIEEKADAMGVPVGVRVMAEDKQDANIFVLAPTHKFRSALQDIVHDLRARFNPKVHMDFASWRDGWGSDGLRVDQFVSKGAHSAFISPASVRLTRYHARGKVDTQITVPPRIVREAFDVLIDLPSGKLYVGGRACTSKDIPSQTSTAEIMRALLEAEGHRLHNAALPESSYAKYRNELQGKIVGPLVAIAKKRLRRNLVLKIEGTLTNFWLSLDPQGFDIGLVTELASSGAGK
ncbi:MAG: hypothetical protein Q8R16_04910 [bacterium]|nr:hypothetical protein [bacterium]